MFTTRHNQQNFLAAMKIFHPCFSLSFSILLFAGVEVFLSGTAIA
jgi:hypothetical protein